MKLCSELIVIDRLKALKKSFLYVKKLLLVAHNAAMRMRHASDLVCG